MSNKILIKRGLNKNISNLTLEYGELALAYNDDKTKTILYAGNGNGIVAINPDIDIPTKISELMNDSNFQTENQVTTAIANAISSTGHATFKKVDSIPTVKSAEDNILYLVMNNKTGHYDIYAKIDHEVVLIDDTTVDLSGYAKSSDLDNKVDKEDGKGLSTNDYTTSEKNKLARLVNYTHPTYHTAGIIQEDTTHRFVTDTEKNTWNSKLNSSSTIDGGTF